MISFLETSVRKESTCTTITSRTSSSMDNDYDIAIVGMSCRFPGARNLDEFWHNLASGIESITRLSDEEIRESGVPAWFLADGSECDGSAASHSPGTGP